MRRAAFLVVRWLLLFVLAAGLALVLYRHEPRGERLALSALYGATWATVWPLTTVLARWLRGVRRGDDHIGARWRTYDGDDPSKWRHGWLHRSGDVVVAVPMTGSTRLRIAPADVRQVTERPLTRRERLGQQEPMAALEVELADGRVELLVERTAVEDVRRWLGA